MDASSQIQPPAITADMVEPLHHALETIRSQIASRFFGQTAVVDQALTCLLAGGHMLLVGVPGLGKTLLVDALSKCLGLQQQRIQFTPDLVPSDILGSEILDQNPQDGRFFRFIKGPIFTQLLLADEINRASPRTQSALLQAMQEYQVTIAGETRILPSPFHVLATQNPIEQEGTYPLPEAQLDRFLLQITIDYPDYETEQRIITQTTGMIQPPAALTPAINLLEAQALVRSLPLAEGIVTAILRLTRFLRPQENGDSSIGQNLLWGPGPRAGQALALAAKAHCLLQGRHSPDYSDIATLAAPVLRHRLGLSYQARANGLSADDVIKDACTTILD